MSNLIPPSHALSANASKGARNITTNNSSSGSSQPVFGFRVGIGLLGILLAAMTAGLNNRVPSLALVDIQGALSFSKDGASWLSTGYTAGELVAMPFATWCAITFSLRRAHTIALFGMLIIAVVLPFVQRLELLIFLRTFQGICAGALIPMLMMAALRFLPPPIRLHGLALYTMTATFAPNVAFGMTAFLVDYMEDWRWIYWNVIPFGLIATVLVNWGIPQMPLMLSRLREANWIGLAFGIPGLMLLTIGLDQGVRMEWFNSPVIISSLLVGSTLILLFLWSEWFHPSPFMRLQLLERRNLWLGFFIFVCLLITMTTAVGLPATILIQLHDFRMAQIAPIGLILGLPQLVMGSFIALLLYQRWVNACYMFALGLIFISAACWFCSGITSEWMAAQFLLPTILQAIGQPMAVVSLLFLSTSVVAPMEGGYVAGIVNTLRGIGTVTGGALISQLMFERGQFHSEMLLNTVGGIASTLPHLAVATDLLGGEVVQQANVMAVADIYRIFGFITLLLVPLALLMKRTPAPVLTTNPSVPTVGKTHVAAP